MAPIGITGATGCIGGRVARQLADQGVEQRLLVRDRSRAPELAGAEIVEFGGYADRVGMMRALEGVETLLLVSAGESANRVEEHGSAIDAAVAAGVDRIVYTSFLPADRAETFTLAEAAETLSRVTGREVRYVDETLEEARESRAPSGAPDWEIEGWVTSYTQIATGEMDVVSDTVRRLAGHPPLTLEEFLRRHPWQHLTH